MPVVIDSFDRPDNPTSLGTADTGQTWVAFGTWGIDSGQAYNQDPGSVTALIESGENNVDAQIDLTLGAGGTLPGLVFRAASDADRLGIFLNANTGTYELWRTRGGAGSVITSVPAGITANNTYTIRVVAEDLEITGWLDGVQVLSHTLTGDDTQYVQAGYTQVGMRGSTHHRWDNLRAGPIDDDDDDDEEPPAAPGKVDVVAAYQDGDNSGGCQVTVTDVQPGDWIVAAFGSIYTDPASTQVHADQQGTWVEIGSPLGSPLEPNFENYGLRTWRLTAETAGDYTVTTTGTNNETTLGVLHLRSCDSVDGGDSNTVDVVVAQNATDGVVDLGSITTSADNCLLVAVYGLVQFASGSHGWTPPSGMTEQVDVTPGNPFNLLGIATEEIPTAGPSGAKSAVSTVNSGNGEAGRLFAIIPAAAGDEREGVGQTGITVSVTGIGRKTAATAAATGLVVAAAGTGRAERSSVGAAGLTTSATGTGAKTATGQSAAGIALNTAAAGRKIATGAGTAGLTLAPAGTGRRAAAGASTAGLTLTASGTGRGSRAGAGAGATGLTLTTTGASGHVQRPGQSAAGIALNTAAAGRKIATGAGTVGIVLAATGRGGSGVKGTGTAGLTLAATGTGHTARTGTATVGIVLGAAGAGEAARAGTGTAGLVLAARGAKTFGEGTGAAGLTLAANGTGQTIRTGSGTVGLVVAATSTEGHRIARGTGTARLALATGPTTGHRVGRGTGETAVALDTSGAGDRAATGAGLLALTLAATATAGPVARRGSGAAGVLFEATGATRRHVSGTGTARLVLRVRPRRLVPAHRLVATGTTSRLEASA